MAALLSSLLGSFLFGAWFIRLAKKIFRAKARPLTPERHKQKDDMPTMGGLFILLIVISNTLLWCNLKALDSWLFILTLVSFGFIGLIDDWLKISKRKGIRASLKFLLQLTFSLIIGVILYSYYANPISLPFFKNIIIDLGLLYIVWVAFIMIGCSNAVNLTDGLDGLAIGSLIPNFATFTLIAYLTGHYAFAQYLFIPFTASSEIAIIGASLLGASIGFLWYNSYPAQIFMGDVGALSLGAALALLALRSGQEFLLLISGGLFVIETLSVIIQVLSFRYLGRRMFKMAPIHHHFELLGWQESKITVRFGIISLILCIIALMTLKIR